MDLTATCMCKENNLPIVVFDMDTVGNLKKVITGEEIVTCRALNASDLVEANEKGELKGKLKEIAAGLNEESNSVIMLIKRKK